MPREYEIKICSASGNSLPSLATYNRSNTSKRVRVDCSFVLAVSAGSSYLGQTDSSGVSSSPQSKNKSSKSYREILRE